MSDAVIVALITLVGTIITTIVSSTGNRKALSNKIDGVDEKLQKHIKDDAQERAVTARARIIRFRNEIRHGAAYDIEYWESILKDITFYKKFCAEPENKDFPNEVCMHSIAFLEKRYDELLNTNGFAED